MGTEAKSPTCPELCESKEKVPVNVARCLLAASASHIAIRMKGHRVRVVLKDGMVIATMAGRLEYCLVVLRMSCDSHCVSCA